MRAHLCSPRYSAMGRGLESRPDKMGAQGTGRASSATGYAKASALRWPVSCWERTPTRGGGGVVAERLTAKDAYREGKLSLPPGYGLEYGANVLLLRREDGSVAAAFGARGTAPSEVVRTAEEDHRRNGKSSA